jgi:hypothetical protein
MGGDECDVALVLRHPRILVVDLQNIELRGGYGGLEGGGATLG